MLFNHSDLHASGSSPLRTSIQRCCHFLLLCTSPQFSTSGIGICHIVNPMSSSISVLPSFFHRATTHIRRYCSSLSIYSIYLNILKAQHSFAQFHPKLLIHASAPSTARDVRLSHGRGCQRTCFSDTCAALLIAEVRHLLINWRRPSGREVPRSPDIPAAVFPAYQFIHPHPDCFRITFLQTDPRR